MSLFKKFIFYTACAFVLLSSLASCEDEINVDDNFRLTFSTDTLRFDTIFTNLGSTTLKLKVYNTSDRRAHIESIRLMQGQYYALNINGLSANSEENVYLNANDSMVIFVQAELPSNDQNKPFIIRDSIQFLLNHHEQKVQLEAYGRNAVWMNDSLITENTTFSTQLPYLISDSLCVAEGATLTLPAGTHLYFRKHAKLLVHGTLRSEGTLQNPVLMRGDRDDYMNTIPPLNYDLCSGQWGGVRFTHTSKNNLLLYTDVRNADFGVVVDSTTTDGLALRIESSQIRNMLYNVLTVVNARVEIYNSLLYNAGGYVAAMYGGHTEWLQTTLANYYQFSWGGRTQPILLLSNEWKDKGGETHLHPLYFQMTNSIIYGSYASELSANIVESDQTNAVFFQNCLLKYTVTSVVSNPPFDACVFKADPKFVFQSWEEETAPPHVYDFHLQEGSAAQGIGNVKALPANAIDLDGNPRLLDGKCEAGCYEIVQ